MNKTNVKEKFTLIILFAFLLSSIVQVSVNAQTPAADTKEALAFLKDVIGIDIEKYEVTLVSSGVQDYTNEDNPIGNLGYIQTSGIYKLIYWDTATETYSSMEFMFSFANSTLRLCSLNVLSGEPYYSKPLSSDMLEAATVLLGRYEALSGDMELTTMRNMLTTVDVTKNSTKMDNNLKLEVSATSDRTYLEWIQSQNGVDYNSLTIGFKNGAFLDFFDSRSYRTIGSAEVNISKEQAIDLALKEANGFSYTYNGKLVDNLTIVKDAIRVELKANVRDKPTLFYPCWIVDLPLDAVYPGSIYFIQVKIWADTGQVISCKTMGYGGPLPNDDPNDSTPTDSAPTATSTPENVTPTQIENSTLPPSTIIIAVIVAAVLIPILIAAIALKKKKSK